MTNTAISSENKKVKKSLTPLVVAGFLLAGGGPSPIYADCIHVLDLPKTSTVTFSFGPGASPTASASRFFTVPHKTLVHVRGCLDASPSLTAVPVIIEVRTPEITPAGDPISTI